MAKRKSKQSKQPQTTQRRTGSRREPGSAQMRWLVPTLAGLTGLVIVLVVVSLLGSRGSDSAADVELPPLPERGDPALLEDVEVYASEGQIHVAPGSPVSYATMPPTSGSHYARATAAGFYSRTPPLGSLVHSLEHGAVIIYYDPERLAQDKEAEEHLRTLARGYRSTWMSVIVAPKPEPDSDPDSPYILTAWTVMLRLAEYDPARVEAFLAEYLGRGPENRVR